MEQTFKVIDEQQKTEIVTVVNNLVSQANRAIVETDEHMEKAGDLVKIMNAHLKKLEAKRKDFVDPLNKTVKKINAEFKISREPLEGAISKVKGLMTIYIREQERKQREAEEAARREAEEKALQEAEEKRLAAEALAEEMRAKGDEEAAQATLEKAEQSIDNNLNQVAQAVSVSNHTAKGPSYMGSYGATAHSRKIRKWRVNDIRQIPVRFLQLDETEIKKALHNEKNRVDMLAQDNNLTGNERKAFVREKMEQFKIPGLEFYLETSAVVR